MNEVTVGMVKTLGRVSSQVLGDLYDDDGGSCGGDRSKFLDNGQIREGLVVSAP